MADTKTPTTGDTGTDSKPAKGVGTGKKIIRYIGTADVREIDAAAFKNVGLEHGKVVFDRKNRWQMTDEGMSPEVVEYFDKDDDGFVVKDVED